MKNKEVSVQVPDGSDLPADDLLRVVSLLCKTFTLKYQFRTVDGLVAVSANISYSQYLSLWSALLTGTSSSPAPSLWEPSCSASSS